MDVELFKEQQQVLQYLKDKDSCLVVAKTGSGKTYIALKKVEQVLKKQTGNAIFFTSTNVLLDQHYETAKNFQFTSCKIKAGLKIPDFHNKKNTLFFVTGHYGELLYHRNTFPSNLKVAIFDEAHKARSENHPYSKVVKHLRCKTYGFTASPGTLMEKRKIMRNLNLKFQVVGNSPFNYQRNLVIKPCTNDPLIDKASQWWLNYIVSKYSKIHKVFETNYFSPLNRMLSLSKKENFKDLIGCTMYTYYQYFWFYYCYEQMFYQCPSSFFHGLNRITSKSKIHLPPNLYVKAQEVRNVWPGKYAVMEQIISETEGLTLIFFENFNTCKDFETYLLQKYSSDNIVVLAGKSKMSNKQRSLSLKQNLALKVILATSVIEEGVSIKDVDHVVFYKPISSPIRYIQRQGRTGRYKDGVVTVLYYKGTYEQTVAKKIQKIKLTL